MAQTQLLALEKSWTIADRLSAYTVHAPHESERLFFCAFSNLEVAKASAVDKIKPRDGFYVVLFDSQSAVYRAGLSGSIAVLICFQSSSGAPFSKEQN